MIPRRFDAQGSDPDRRRRRIARGDVPLPAPAGGGLRGRHRGAVQEEAAVRGARLRRRLRHLHREARATRGTPTSPSPTWTRPTTWPSSYPGVAPPSTSATTPTRSGSSAAFFSDDRPVAHLCHGPLALAAAGVLRGGAPPRTRRSSPTSARRAPSTWTAAGWSTARWSPAARGRTTRSGCASSCGCCGSTRPSTAHRSLSPSLSVVAIAPTDAALQELTSTLPAGRVLVDTDAVDRFRTTRPSWSRAGTRCAVVRPASTAEVQAVMRVAAAHGVRGGARAGPGSGLSGGAAAIDGVHRALHRGDDSGSSRSTPANMIARVEAGRAQRRPRSAAAAAQRALVRARPRQPRLLHDRRQHRHQRRRPLLREVRRHAGERARGHRRAGRRRAARGRRAARSSGSRGSTCSPCWWAPRARSRSSPRRRCACGRPRPCRSRGRRTSPPSSPPARRWWRWPTRGITPSLLELIDRATMSRRRGLAAARPRPRVRGPPPLPVRPSRRRPATTRSPCAARCCEEAGATPGGRRGGRGRERHADGGPPPLLHRPRAPGRHAAGGRGRPARTRPGAAGAHRGDRGATRVSRSPPSATPATATCTPRSSSTAPRPTSAARAHDAAGAIFEAALDLGGTITGEHGVGTLKLPWLESEIGTRARATRPGIKGVFDPRGSSTRARRSRPSRAGGARSGGARPPPALRSRPTCGERHGILLTRTGLPAARRPYRARSTPGPSRRRASSAAPSPGARAGAVHRPPRCSARRP